MTKATCSFPDCGRKVHALGLCPGHRAQLRSTGSLVPIAERGTCSVDGCDGLVMFVEMCKVHRDRVREYGRTELLTRPTSAERFWAKVEKTDTCWLWTSTRNSFGYGSFLGDEGRQTGAHRFSLKLAGVTIPPGYDVDHLCRVPSCVNPDHLEPGTHAENMARAPPYTGAHWQAEKTHCKNGHEFTLQNTGITTKGTRRCRECRNEGGRQRRRRLASQ